MLYREEKMYEIPPSVDWYLRFSSKSRIHFPAVNDDNTSSESCESIFKVESPKLPAENGLNSPELERCSSNDIIGKRKFEDSEDNLARRKRPKNVEELCSVHVNYQTSSCPCNYEESCPNKPHKAQKSMLSPQQRDETREEFREQDEEDFHKIQKLVKKLPQIRPKLNGESNLVYRPHNNSTRKNPWGSESYSDLISSAIRSFPDNRATLQQIYEWIVGNVPHFADKADYPSTKGWKNAIRHTLSIRKRFTRIINDTSPHSSLWTFSKFSYKTTKCR